MGDLVPVIISGIASGSAFALLALSIVIIFRSTDTVNFAVGDTGTLAVYVAFTAVGLGAPIFLGLIIAIIVAAILGVATERFLIRPLGHGKHVLFVALVVTIGLGLLIQASMGTIWGQRVLPFPPLVPGTVHIAGVAIAWTKIVATVIALIAMGIVGWFFGFTPLGIAMRASAEDPFAARLVGLDANRIARLAWFLGGGLAAVSMFFLAADSSLNPNLAEQPLFRAFAGVFLGGLTSMPGAVVGGFAIGILDNLAGRYVSANYRDTMVFAVIVLVLFLKPAGFLGIVRQERV